MSTVMTSPARAATGEMQYASFQIGDLLLGIDIHQVQEINRNLRLTSVPHAPDAIRGVINLRGEVVTVIDLRSVLGLAPAELTRLTRNVIVNHGGEQIGLLVDSVADVVACRGDAIDPLPENLGGLDHAFFEGVFKLDQGLLVILNVAETIATIGATADN